MNKVKVPYKTMAEKKAEIERWLEENAGRGSARYGGREGTINHWLNGDDYCYYSQFTVGDMEDLETLDTMFIFRDEKTATEFALRFA